MEASVKVYEQLAALTDTTYHFANSLRRYRWSKEELGEFRQNLAAQKKWLDEFKKQHNKSDAGDGK